MGEPKLEQPQMPAVEFEKPQIKDWVKIDEWEYKQDKSGRWRERAAGKRIPGVYISKARISELGLDDPVKLAELAGQAFEADKPATPEQTATEETVKEQAVAEETEKQKVLFAQITENARILQNAITTLEKTLMIAKEEKQPRKELQRIETDIANLQNKLDALVGDGDIETMLGEKVAAGESVEELSSTIKQLAEMAEASIEAEKEKHLVDEPVSAKAKQVAAERVAAGQARSKNVFQELSDKMNSLQSALVEKQKQLAIKKSESGLWKRWFNKQAKAEIAQLNKEVADLQEQMKKLTDEIGTRDIGEVVGERAIAQEQQEKETAAELEAEKTDADRIAEVGSFEELLAILEKVGMEKYKGRIENAQKYSAGLSLAITKKAPLVRSITRENGLRAKTVELVNKQTSALERAA